MLASLSSGCVVGYWSLAGCMLLLHLPAAAAQISPAGPGLEFHAGYGGGGLHADGLVGGGATQSLGASMEGILFLTAVVARPAGRAVFGGVGARFTPLHWAARPYLAVGPLIAVRSYAEGRLGGFASVGLDTAIPGSDRRWRAFLEGRAMHGGGDWTQLVGGVRVTLR